MSKIIVIGDIHNRWVQAEEIASKYDSTHTIIFVGDYFDNFYDTALDADQTARWLKSSLQKENRIHLLGNHDINYAYYNHRPLKTGYEQLYHCAGYTPQKDDAINRIMVNEDWDKIKIAHKQNGFWFSHAGFHPMWFGTFAGMTDISINEKLKDIQISLETRSYSSELCGAGRCRGGSNRVGGLLWRDHIQESYTGDYWNDNSGIKQVCGHTPLRKGIDIEETAKGGVCINVDCGLKEILEITETGEYNIIKTGLSNFYSEAEERKLEHTRNTILKNIGAYDDIYKDL
jgi:hypothetical protein